MPHFHCTISYPNPAHKHNLGSRERPRPHAQRDTTQHQRAIIRQTATSVFWLKRLRLPCSKLSAQRLCASHCASRPGATGTGGSGTAQADGTSACPTCVVGSRKARTAGLRTAAADAGSGVVVRGHSPCSTCCSAPSIGSGGSEIFFECSGFVPRRGPPPSRRAQPGCPGCCPVRCPASSPWSSRVRL